MNTLLGRSQQRRTAPHVPLPPQLSDWSTPGVHDSAWCSLDFMLGAGMVLIQKNTHKIVVVYETQKKYWFFPRGRKDIGESLEQTALREAYEESGYRAEFMPIYNPTRQPHRPEDRDSPNLLNTEPVFMALMSWLPKIRRGQRVDSGGEYLTTWYVGQIPEDAVSEVGTGMPDEQNYQSSLLSIDEAMKNVFGAERRVLCYVWTIYCETLRYLEAQETQAEQVPDESSSSQA